MAVDINIPSAWRDLPHGVKDAALYGLRDPIDSGAPHTEDEVISHYTAGATVANLGGVANLDR